MYRSFQAAWFKKWPWIHYDQVNDRAFCFTCRRASRLANFKVCASKGDDAFLTRGYYNWKGACGENCGRFVSHEYSNIHKYCIKLLEKPPKNVAERLLSDICRKEDKFSIPGNPIKYTDRLKNSCKHFRKFTCISVMRILMKPS